MAVQAAPNEDPLGFPTPVREELVQTAVKFLENPKVSNTPLAQKQKFLQKKGLTNEEIQLACERSGSYLLHNEQLMAPAPPPPPNPYVLPVPMGSYRQLQQQSLFHRIREIIHNAALVSIVVYAAYSFYKKFIQPFLFGKKKKSIDENLEELKQSLTSVKVEVEKIQKDTDTATNRQLQTLTTEISTVKGLLLSRKQFPTVTNSPVVPQSIPAWQMSSAASDAESKGDELLEIGSGFSDPEHITKTSDSSIELM